MSLPPLHSTPLHAEDCYYIWYRAKVISPVQVPVGRANSVASCCQRQKKVRVSASPPPPPVVTCTGEITYPYHHSRGGQKAGCDARAITVTSQPKTARPAAVADHVLRQNSQTFNYRVSTGSAKAMGVQPVGRRRERERERAGFQATCNHEPHCRLKFDEAVLLTDRSRYLCMEEHRVVSVPSEKKSESYCNRRARSRFVAGRQLKSSFSQP